MKTILDNSKAGIDDEERDAKHILFESYADYLISSRKYSEGLHYLVELVKERQTDVDLRVKTATIFFKVAVSPDHKRESINQLEQVLIAHPNHNEALRQLGRIYSRS